MIHIHIWKTFRYRFVSWHSVSEVYRVCRCNTIQTKCYMGDEGYIGWGDVDGNEYDEVMNFLNNQKFSEDLEKIL